jgi:DNA recombination protein RmuC
MTALTVVFVILTLLLGTAVIALLFRKPQAQDTAVRELRSDVQLLRQATEQSIQNVATIFSTQLQTVTSNVQSSLAGATSDLGGRLESINRQVTEQLNQSSNLMNINAQTVGERMASVQNTFAGLQKQVGEMTEQARQLSDLSKSVTAIEHVLRAPKMRGNFGEEQLESLLALVFAKQQYEMQYRFPSGEIADAVLFLPLGNVAIDSKFPLENFRRIVEGRTEDEKKSARRDFLKDVRKRVDEIAARYIRPAEGTLPLALMYVPAENVYYETIIRDDEGSQLYRYCLEKRVIPVSPNSFYAYLQTIAVGLKGMQVNERAESIVREIESLKIELEKFDKAYDTVGQHLRNASNKFDEGTKLLNKVELRVEGLAGNRAEQTVLFPEAEKKSLGAGKG